MERKKKEVSEPYLDAFLIIDPADHLHTHLSNLTEGWLLQTDISENLDHSLSHTYTSVLNINYQINLKTHDNSLLCEALNKKQDTFLNAWIRSNSIGWPTDGSIRL